MTKMKTKTALAGMDNGEDYNDEAKYLWMGRGQHWQYIDHLNDGVPSRGTGGPPPTPSRVGGVNVTMEHSYFELELKYTLKIQVEVAGSM